MNNQIIELLENNELRQKVITAIKEVWSLAGTHYDSDEEVQEDAKKYGTSPWEEAWWRVESCAEAGEIEKAFDKYVIQRMAKPYRLTLEELVEVFFDLAKPDERHYTDFEQFTSDDCNNLYAIFVNYIKNHVLSYRHSDPFPICAITSDEVVEDERPLWEKNGISVRLLRGTDVIDQRPAGKKLYQILAIIEGNISISACRDLHPEMSRILRIAIWSADLLQGEGFGGKYKVVEPTIPLLYEREIAGLPWGGENLLENGKPLIKQYMDAYYSEPSKKDSIDKRIRNAVILLLESDSQSNDAIGLALSMTAIEALLGEEGTEITVKLAENVAALLEPDRNQRQSAREFVKKSYNTRSRALHGEEVETEGEARISSRHLAAAVLSGVIFRRDFLSRLGYEAETPRDLLEDLHKSFASGQPVGIVEYNICSLWRKKEAGKKDSSL